MTNSVFPIGKKFKNAITSSSIVFLNEECVIYNKCFRLGTIFFVNGWREINGKVFLIISKGSWEALVELEKYSPKLDKIDGK